jgi:phage shock protein PspC (stress-responsive transcriptional regulator)
MSQVQARLPFRSDTLLGVCEGIGEDFGFHANWLRIAFALGFYFSPAGVTAAYLGLGVLVLVSRSVYPKREHKPAVQISCDESHEQAQDVEATKLPLAA